MGLAIRKQNTVPGVLPQKDFSPAAGESLLYWIRIFFQVVFLASLYFLVAKLGLKLASVHPSSTIIWPPSGIALAAMLVAGWEIWPGIFIGAFFANITTYGTLLTSLGIALGNTLEAVAGAYLVFKYAGGRSMYVEPKHIFRFAVFAVPASVLSASFGVGVLTFAGLSASHLFLRVWGTWWLGDTVSIVIITPFLLTWSNDSQIRWPLKKIAEIAALAAALFLIFSAWFSNFFSRQWR